MRIVCGQAQNQSSGEDLEIPQWEVVGE